MRNLTKPEVTYSGSGDLLSVWIKGPSKGGAHIVTMHPNISSFYNPAGKCVGLYWYDAGNILLPALERDDLSEVEKYPELLIDYCRKTDALVFGNRKLAVHSEEMAAGLTAHIGADGQANRFTMENVSDTLLFRFRHPNWNG